MKVSLEVLRRRNVLLLISGLDMSREELSILEEIYNESRIHGSRTNALYEDRWHFRKRPILVVLDPQGRELSPIMQQIKKLLSYDKDGSWALLCRGSKILTNGNGTTMMQTPSDFDMWKKDIETKGFDLSFMEYHDKLHVAANNCCRFEFPVAASRVPDGMRCPECHRVMEKYIAFLCCHDQDGPLELD
uniref:Sieve element occlusion C-terminal domain-containing protein n=2 Tax=Lactuca sativa TaxID=4236 RepID=A0A9R1VB19_LACSA|nr:hypothetical protein LSAT_V11C600304160 [Lactuca sativa]